jgi:3-hydroxyisobutyrate dehydrogenase
MGLPMATCLLKRARVGAYDVRADQVARLAAEAGGQPMATLAELGSRSDVVLTILPTSAIVGQVPGPDGLAPGCPVPSSST